MINYVIGIGAFLIVLFVIRNFVKSVKSGNSNCGCDCKGCSSKHSCNSSDEYNKDKK